MILSHYTVPTMLLQQTLQWLRKQGEPVMESASEKDSSAADPERLRASLLAENLENLMKQQEVAAHKATNRDGKCQLTAEENRQKEALLQEIKLRVTGLKLRE